MDNSLLVFGFLLIAALTAFALFLNKKLSDLSQGSKLSDELVEWLRNTGTRLDQQNKVFNSTLQDSTKVLNERLDNAARVIAQVQKNIGEMSEIGRGMKELQEFLKSPKLRGNIGEQVLKELLSQMLPKQTFHLQYPFKSGVIVDAAIKTTAGIVPVDAKFPMESFRRFTGADSDAGKKDAEKEFHRDVKRHIDAIASKYILTDEGTIDYALMYFPSEAVYYEVVNHNDLFDYASQKRVLPVSPTTFYAYLKAILMSFEGQKIEARAREILATIKAVQKDYEKAEESLTLLGKHLTNAFNQMPNVSTTFNRLGQKLATTQALGQEVKDEAKDVLPELHE